MYKNNWFKKEKNTSQDTKEHNVDTQYIFALSHSLSQ